MGIHDGVVLKLRMHIQMRKLPTQISSFYTLLEYMDGKNVTRPTTRSLYAFVSLMSFVCYRQWSNFAFIAKKVDFLLKSSYPEIPLSFLFSLPPPLSLHSSTNLSNSSYYTRNNSANGFYKA